MREPGDLQEDLEAGFSARAAAPTEDHGNNGRDNSEYLDCYGLFVLPGEGSDRDLRGAAGA
jgi:hypothetical protein